MNKFDEYYDDRETIKYFWRCSIEGRMDEFDFEKAIEFFNNKLYEKLAIHGLLDYESFCDYMFELVDISTLKSIEINNNWIQITADELQDVVLNHMYIRYQSEFFDFPEFQDLQELYKELNDFLNCPSDYDRIKRVTLYDKCIHAQHVTGFVMDICDMDKFRTTFETEYEKELKRNL